MKHLKDLFLLFFLKICLLVIIKSEAAKAWEPSLGAGCVSGGSGMCIDADASSVFPNSFWCEKLDIQGGCYY